MRWQAKEATVASSEVWRIKMKNESRIIGAEINMKDSNATIQESKLPLDEDDQLLIQSGGGRRGGAGGGIGVGIWE
jgi:hypothetical protein